MGYHEEIAEAQATDPPGRDPPIALTYQVLSVRE